MRRVMRLTILLLAALPVLCRAAGAAGGDAGAAAPSTQPATGELDLTFTQRSPLSSPKELTARLGLKPHEVDADYDLSQQPFKAYVPTNYDPATPVGIIVYMGYKDTVSSPPPWRPLLERHHLIFISSVCHTGAHYSPSVPLWQTVGLALDAVDNLKRSYAIDSHRIYLMTFTEDAYMVPYATSDVFDGFIVTYDLRYFKNVTMSDGRYLPSSMPMPPLSKLKVASTRPFFLIADTSDMGSEEMTAKVAAMKHDGFRYVMLTKLSNLDDLHFPNFKADWFEQEALPFFDATAAEIAAARTAPKVVRPPAAAPETADNNATNNAAASPPSQAAGPTAAQHLLSMAKLFINNGQPDLARARLHEILDKYSSDPVAAQAKQMLDQLGN